MLSLLVYTFVDFILILLFFCQFSLLRVELNNLEGFSTVLQLVYHHKHLINQSLPANRLLRHGLRVIAVSFEAVRHHDEHWNYFFSLKFDLFTGNSEKWRILHYRWPLVIINDLRWHLRICLIRKWILNTGIQSHLKIENLLQILSN